MALIRYAATVGGLTMVSRVFGFVRDILIASLVGPGMVGDAFFVAFKLPNFFRRLFAEGAFNAGFVPIFAEVLEREGRVRARAFAEQALSVLLLTLFLFVAVLQAAMPWAMYGFAPGFAGDAEKFDVPRIVKGNPVFPLPAHARSVHMVCVLKVLSGVAPTRKRTISDDEPFGKSLLRLDNIPQGDARLGAVFPDVDGIQGTLGRDRVIRFGNPG